MLKIINPIASDFINNPDFLCYSGSRLYGTETINSDTDIRGFTFLPAELVLGIKHWELYEDNKNDIVIWSIDKFVRMLLNGSTIAFEMMSCPIEQTLRKTELAEEILRHRAKFVSKKVLKSILGYAQSEWRKTLGLTTRDLGEIRKEHIKQIGYSYKNAYHAIRILNEGLELTKSRYITFPIESREFLKAVKQGLVNFKDVEVIYQARLSSLEEALSKSDLLDNPNTEYINNLICRLKLKKILLDLIPTKTYKGLFFQPEIIEGK